MKKVLIATEKPFAKGAVESIKKVIADAGYEAVMLEGYTDKAQLHTALADANAVIIRSDIIDKEAIEAAKNLEIIVRAGAGYDNVDTGAAKEKNMVVMNTPGQNSNAVAELALGLMLYGARNLFNGSSGTELKGKTLGLYALGYTAKALAKLVKGFEMNVMAYAPTKSDDILKEEGVARANTPEELFKQCQYVSLHIPSKAETKGCISHALLSLMPKGATLINTARKEVVDEEGLAKMFAERPDFKYLTDIAPVNKESLETAAAGRMYTTPKKMGAQTAEANNNAGIAAATQIVNFFKNGDTTFRVN